jgi:hypothetical protein
MNQVGMSVEQDIGRRAPAGECMEGWRRQRNVKLDARERGCRKCGIERAAHLRGASRRIRGGCATI